MNIINHPNFKLNLKYIKVVSNFYIYNYNFLCHGYGLTSLYGCPRIVRGYFDCSNNNLTSLKYCPVEVYESFRCSFDLLKSLEYCPKYVGGNFYCCFNKVQFTEEYVRSLCEVKGRVYC